MAAAKPSSSSSPVPPETIQKAVGALLKWKETKSKSQTSKLLDQDEFVYLILTLKKIPANPRVNPFKIPLPHPLFDPTSSEICLIVDDRPKSKLTKEAAAKKVKDDGVPVSKVLKLSKLRANYKPFEAKRKLCDSYELFLADKGVLPVLPKLLGKQFYKRKKIPIGLDLRHSGWKEQVQRVISCGLLFLGSGTCSVIRVARISMSREDIVENVAAAIEGVVETLPKKWKNVRSLHLKLLESLALPVYQTVPDVKLRIEGNKGEHHDEEEAVVDTKEGGGEKESLGKKKKTMKGRMREVRYMDVELDEDEGDGDDNNEDEDEEPDVGDSGGKKRKKGKEELCSENGKKKKKVNKRGDPVDDVQRDEDFAELSDVKRLKKLTTRSARHGKLQKEEGMGRTGVATSIVGEKVFDDKKEKKKGDKLVKLKHSKQ